MAGFWDDFWGSINKPINFTPPTQGQTNAVRGPTDSRDQMSDLYARNQAGGVARANAAPRPPMTPQGSNSLQILKSGGQPKLPGLRNTSEGWGTRQGNDDIPESRYRDGPGEDEQRMEQIKALLDQEFAPSGEYGAMVDEAYASALGNIGKARGQANSNFQESDARIAGLTAGHVNEIQTKDRDAVNKIGGDLQSSYKETYGDARGQLQGAQNSEIAAKTEMLKRLGQEEAGVGTAGQSESEAMTRLTEQEAGAQKQAQGYQAADLTRNVEQAQSQASAGVERRSALSRDLQKILGGLDESEATVNNAKSMAKLSGLQSEKNDFRQQQQFNLDSLTQMEDRIEGKADKTWERSFKERELASKNSGGSGGSKYDVISNDISARGVDPAPYLDAYAEVSAMPFNPQVNGDKLNWTISQMEKAAARKGLKLDKTVALRLAGGIEDYGTDKLG